MRGSRGARSKSAPRSMAKDAPFFATPSRGSGCPRARTVASSRSRAPSWTCSSALKCAPRTWPKPFATAAFPRPVSGPRRVSPERRLLRALLYAPRRKGQTPSQTPQEPHPPPPIATKKMANTMARMLREGTSLGILLFGLAIFSPQVFAQTWDLSVAKSGPSQIAAPGIPITYSISVTNFGPDDATTVTLTDNVPAGATFTSFAQNSGPAFTCTTPAVGGGGTITCTIATLAAGASASFTLAVNAAPSAAGNTIINTASASTATADPDPSNDSGSAFTAVMAPNADLAVTKTAPASVVAGANVSYSIGLANNGPQAAQSTSLTDTLPAGTIFGPPAQTAGPVFPAAPPAVGGTGAVTCTNASLSAAASATFTLMVQSSVASAGTTVTNTASASSTTADPNPANNSASAVTSVAAPAAHLAVTKTAPASVIAGSGVYYSIVLN